MEPFTFILLELAFIIGMAAVGRGIALYFNQASVLGELAVGVLLGNIFYWLGAPLATVIMHFEDTQKLVNEVWMSGVGIDEAAASVFTAKELAEGGIPAELVNLLVGPHASEIILMSLSLWIFSNLGVILLLFMVGLENSVAEMLKVGSRSLMVSIFGVIAPFFFGLLVSLWLLPEASTSEHLFLGATLCATSVGITARVLGDLGRLKSQESRVILGAAVIDDILGLIILAIVIGIISSGSVQMTEVARIVLLSGAFLIGVMLFGEKLVSWSVQVFYRIFNRLQVKLLFPLALAFLMAAFTNYIGLAAIVGAFAAGLIVSNEHFDDDAEKSPTTQDLIGPIQSLFAPVFFVLMGMQVNLESFLHVETLLLATVFTIAAIAGKLISGFVAGRGINRLAVGLGMIPRGEVGLIFASIGKGLGVVDDAVFSAIVIMVVITTLITPSLLKWSLEKQATC